MSLFLLFLQMVAPTAQLEVKATYAKAGNVFVGTLGSSFRRISLGAEGKRLPVWSRDGMKVAYLAESHEPSSLGTIGIVTVEGDLHSEIPVRYGPNSGPGMQFVESLQWISDQRIAVSGSLNPSTVETLVFDTTTAKLVDDLDDDMGGAVFSPNGLHVAYISGAPHFSPQENSLPALTVDQKHVFPAHEQHVVMLTRPVWSQDSQMLAIVARDYTTESLMVYIWKSNGQSGTTSFVMEIGQDQLIYPSWAGHTLYVVTDKAALGFSNGRVLSAPAPGTIIDDQAQAIGLNHTLTRRLQAEGAQDVDLWCQSCPLDHLPFGQGLRVRPDQVDLHERLTSPSSPATTDISHP